MIYVNYNINRIYHLFNDLKSKKIAERVWCNFVWLYCFVNANKCVTYCIFYLI